MHWIIRGQVDFGLWAPGMLGLRGSPIHDRAPDPASLLAQRFAIPLCLGVVEHHQIKARVQERE